MSAVNVKTLRQFYDACHSTIPVRRALTEDVLRSRPPDADGVGHLHDVLDALTAIPEEPAGRRLVVDDTRAVHVDLGYEIEELRKDLLFLEEGDQALRDDFVRRHDDFDEQVQAGLEALGGQPYQAFITDRDGTVNNYCGRYASSVQSTYNAVFLTRFARAGAATSVVLTSAPLDNIGLADLAVQPPGAVIVAGSKGREYFDAAGERRRYPIDAAQQGRLDILNAELDRLLERPGNEAFTLIGSGLQHKFGQTTIARQDISGSVAADHSGRFLADIRDLVRSVDPDGSFFRIEDTGLDVEVLLTVDDADGATRDFDKGDGVRFLNDDVGLEMGGGACLVCGDTASDVPMLVAALELAPETRSVFVTRDDGLRRKVRDVLPETVFVTEPDMLVAILDGLSRR